MFTDDSPEREFDKRDTASECVPLPVKHDESTSNLSEIEALSNRSNPMENPKPSRKPRREVWWLDLGTSNHSLVSVGRCFEGRLNWSLLTSSNFLLPHIRSPKDNNLRQILHQCPGYLREEITLTCDLSKSVIVSHAFPGPSERCSICHQLVQYTYSGSFDSNNIYYLPTLNNSLCPPKEGDHMNFRVGSGQTSSSCTGTRSPGHMDAANQQTQQQQHPTTHDLASSDANNNQATLRLQFNKISRLGSLIFGKKSVFGAFGGDKKSHQITSPPVVEILPPISLPSRNHAQSSTGGRSTSEPHEQQLKQYRYVHSYIT